jgi:hypothetical protein
MPLSPRAWYEEAGSVSLMGSHPALNAEGQPIAPDPLVMFPLDAALEMLGNQEDAEDGLFFDLSPDNPHKAEQAESLQAGAGAYNLTCAAAQGGDRAGVEKWLSIAAEKDADFRSVASEAWFTEVLDRLYPA